MFWINFDHLISCVFNPGGLIVCNYILNLTKCSSSYSVSSNWTESNSTIIYWIRGKKSQIYFLTFDLRILFVVFSYRFLGQNAYYKIINRSDETRIINNIVWLILWTTDNYWNMPSILNVFSNILVIIVNVTN